MEAAEEMAVAKRWSAEDFRTIAASITMKAQNRAFKKGTGSPLPDLRREAIGRLHAIYYCVEF